MKLRARFFLVALLVVLSSAAATGSRLSAATRSEFFNSNGVRLHFLLAGTGEPVVLIHGFAASAYLNWVLPGVFDELKKHYRVIAIDNRGHGESDKPHQAEKYGTEMVEDVVRLLDHLAIKKAHIVGYSMGGFIADKLLATHPDRVLTVTLGGAGWIRAEDDRKIVDGLVESLEHGDGILPLLKALIPPGSQPVPEEQLKAHNAVIMMFNDPHSLSACIRGMRDLTVRREELVKNRLPVLAIVGARDPLKRGVDAMEGVMPHLKVVIVPGGDHVSTFRDPKFKDALKEFLEAHGEHESGSGTADAIGHRPTAGERKP